MYDVGVELTFETLSSLTQSQGRYRDRCPRYGWCVTREPPTNSLLMDLSFPRLTVCCGLSTNFKEDRSFRV